METNFDKELISVKNLKWLPWVGDKFSSLTNDKRLLIIGESHYHDTSPESIAQHDSTTFTRLVIEELAIERFYYGTKIFPNLHRAIFRNDEFDSQAFWDLVSFYNFVQRPMVTNKGRPTYEDYYSSWFIFFDIIKILKPRTCLFLGTSAAGAFNHAVQGTGFKTDGIIFEETISDVYARSAIISDSTDFQIQILFIRHPSQMFSWSKWNDFLRKKISAELDWLNDQISK